MAWLFGPSQQQKLTVKIREHLNDVAHQNDEATRGFHETKTLIHHGLLNPEQIKQLNEQIENTTQNFLLSLAPEELEKITVRCDLHKKNIANQIKIKKELDEIRQKKNVVSNIDFYDNIEHLTNKKVGKITTTRPVFIPQSFTQQISNIYSERDQNLRVLKPLLNKHKRVSWKSVVRDSALIDYLDYFSSDDYERLDLDYLFKKRCPNEPDLLQKITGLSRTKPEVWKINWDHIHTEYNV